MRVRSTLFVCLLLATAGVAVAQPGSVDAFCGTESGSAARLCNDYCGVKACHLANDRDSGTEPRASSAECKKAGKLFRDATGRDAPCEDMVACPCADPAKWSDFVTGYTWQNFLQGAFDPAATTCIEDSSKTTLEQDTADYDPTSVSADSVLGECRVVDGATRQQATLRIGEGEAAACRRLLRRVGGVLCSASGQRR